MNRIDTRSCIQLVLTILVLLGVASGCVTPDATNAPSVPSDRQVEINRVEHGGQELFLSGMNLAWMDFGKDLTRFNERLWREAVDDVSTAGGNTIRWWIHVNGSENPVWDGDRVTGMPEGAIDTLEYALDIAWERGVLIIPCLWSFDILQQQGGMDPERNKRFLEDPENIRTYINNALVPMVEQLGDHPAVVAWEIFNEPEGMTREFGWTPVRTSMEAVQTFINLTAGAIHRTAPEAKVSNGSWNLRASSDVAGYTNYYRDDRLIAAGGDELGTLDFYMVHFYPQHFSDDTSPFHHPASYWELDKPVVIGEFPARGIVDLGEGIRTSTSLSTREAYEYAYRNGYAGALAWTWTGHDGFGDTDTAQPGMMALQVLGRRDVVVETGDIDRMPVRVADLEPVRMQVNDPPLAEPIDLARIFTDEEDATLSYEITKVQPEGLLDATIDDSLLALTPLPDQAGQAVVSIAAIDSAGNRATASVVVHVVDPDRGNVALFKPVTASSVEDEEKSPSLVNDGLDATRWASEYADDQTLTIDLRGTFRIASARLVWETAYGKHYAIEVSRDGGEAWTRVYEETDGDGDVDEIEFDPVLASSVRLVGIERATEWGFSLWELEVYGERAAE
ncbi:MAG: discoidin domain-containing protein [Spirochaetota bacterium]